MNAVPSAYFGELKFYDFNSEEMLIQSSFPIAVILEKALTTVPAFNR